jgi:cytochrome b6-f complex iron-sulfur subunit
MNRHDFLKSLGLSSAALLALSTLPSCSKETSNPQPSPGGVDFTLDLSAPANASLAKNGGFVISGNVIVARTNTGELIALSKICTHDGCDVSFSSSNNNFVCPCHGAQFSTSGAVVLGPARSPLTKYKVQLNNNLLRIYS